MIYAKVLFTIRIKQLVLQQDIAMLSLLQNNSKLSFCGLTAESIKILSSIIDPAIKSQDDKMEFRNRPMVIKSKLILKAYTSKFV